MPSKTWSIMSSGRAVLANFDEGELKEILEGVSALRQAQGPTQGPQILVVCSLKLGIWRALWLLLRNCRNSLNAVPRWAGTDGSLSWIT